MAVVVRIGLRHLKDVKDLTRIDRLHEELDICTLYILLQQVRSVEDILLSPKDEDVQFIDCATACLTFDQCIQRDDLMEQVPQF